MTAEMLPVTTPATACPEWCEGHMPSHISAEKVVVAEAGGERTEIFVSLEQEDRPGSRPAVRLQGAADAPMTGGQALELAAQITYLAHRALFA